MDKNISIYLKTRGLLYQRGHAKNIKSTEIQIIDFIKEDFQQN